MTARRNDAQVDAAAADGRRAGGGPLAAAPGGVLAALAGPPRPALDERWLGRSRPGRTIELARSADLVGVEWRAPAGARVELRFRGHDGRWSGWLAVGRPPGTATARIARPGVRVGRAGVDRRDARPCSCARRGR